MLRWLLPLIAAMTLLGSAITSWAAAGFVGDSSCCCPDKTKCKCHDHDEQPDPTPKLKRCGGEAHWSNPGVTPVVEAATAPLGSDVHVVAVATVISVPTPENPTIEPETPPF